MKRSARVGVPQYSYRHTNIQEKQIYRRLTIIGGLTLVLLLIIWLWGLTFIRIIGGLGTKPTQDDSSQNNISLPLQKPTLSDLPEFTNQDKITISGTANAEANIALTVNGIQVSKTVADASGFFSFADISLKDGLNIIKVTASNKAGESQEEKALVTLDKQPPNLVVSTPSDGQTFPKDTKVVTIKGTSESDATVFVNSMQTILDQNGGFTYSLDVSAGETKIEVKATDKAGNNKVINLKVVVES